MSIKYSNKINKSNQNNSSNENNTESSTQMSSEIPDKFIGTWECWDGTSKNIIKISINEKFTKDGTPKMFGDDLRKGVFFDLETVGEENSGSPIHLIHDKEKDVLKEFEDWRAHLGEISINTNSGHLLMLNNEWEKVD